MYSTTAIYESNSGTASVLLRELHAYDYVTTKVYMKENIKYSIKYKNKMQTTKY